MTESRKEFLSRVDETNTPYEQALFVAIKHLELIAERTGDPVRIAENCLASIDDRLRGEL